MRASWRIKKDGCCQALCSRKSLQQRKSMQASRQRIARQLLGSGGSGGNKRVAQAGYRCFSCSVRQNQQQPPKSRPQDEAPQTTHFGFETIAEALKEQRGKHFTHFSTPLGQSVLTKLSHSRRSLLLSRLLVRLHERLHVPRHPPSLERPLCPQPQPWP